MTDMDCSEYRINFTRYVSGQMDQEEKSEFDRHFRVCPECLKELEETSRIWELMADMKVPDPSPLMKEKFNQALDDYREQVWSDRKTSFQLIRKIRAFSGKLVPKPAFSFVLLLIGLAAGYLLNESGKTAQDKQISTLGSQISEMKQILMLSLLQDQSASRRIQAISYTDDMTSLDKKILDALFSTLNGDPNVNVRLASLEALSRMSDNPAVRMGLIRSINLQDSPIIQSAIADLMVRLKEKSSVRPLRELLERKDLNSTVKVNIEKSLQKLI